MINNAAQNSLSSIKVLLLDRQRGRSKWVWKSYMLEPVEIQKKRPIEVYNSISPLHSSHVGKMQSLKDGIRKNDFVCLGI